MSSDNDDPSPWATDDVPVTSRVNEIVWDREPAPSDDASPPSPTGLASRRNAVLALVATAALAVAVGLLIAWPDTSSSSESDETPDTQAQPTTTATLPAATPEATTSDLSQVDDEPSLEMLDESAVPDIDVAPTEAKPSDLESDAFAIVLPDPILEFESETELVMLTDDLRLVTISLPSAQISTVAIDELADRRALEPFRSFVSTSPDATLVSFDGERTFVVPNGQTPIEIDPDDFTGNALGRPTQMFPLGWLTLKDGANPFLVIVFDGTNGTQSEFLIALDGSVTTTNAQRAPNFFTAPLFARGQRLLNDAGGAYSVAADGSTERVSSGDVLATSQRWRMVRECDPTRLCTTIVERHDGTGRRTASLATEYERASFDAALSPDGTAVAFTSNGFPDERNITELSGGTNTRYGAVSLSSFSGAWASDSSGEFSLDNGPGVLFFDRSSGEAIRFGEELGDLTTLGVRHPIADEG